MMLLFFENIIPRSQVHYYFNTKTTTSKNNWQLRGNCNIFSRNCDFRKQIIATAVGIVCKQKLSINAIWALETEIKTRI